MRGMSGDTIDLERRYTLADLNAFPEDGRRYELADGWLIVSPMARRLHQWGSMGLGDALKTACPTDLAVFTLPINMDDPDNTHFEPDITVVGRQFVAIENGDLPRLCVEIRSPSTAGRDAVLKRREYARLGVASYWLFDVKEPSLRILELEDGEYVERAFVTGEQNVTVDRPFPVTLCPAQLMQT